MVVLPHSHNFMLAHSSFLYPNGLKRFINKCRPFPSPRASKTSTEVFRSFVRIMSLISDHECYSAHKQAASFAWRSLWERSSSHAAAHTCPLPYFGGENNGYQLKLYRVMCTEWDFALRELTTLAQNRVLTKGNISWDVLQNIWVWHYSCNWLFAKCVKTKTSSF